ncbi:MAG: IS1182 family transposase [Dysgonamonadaceae bacterium]|nr:IS1182 family transposase [Dysgonamonadaceae bacterium]
MSKVIFKACNQGQGSLFPVSQEDKIPSNAPVRPVNQTVDTLDIREITGTCKSGGTASYHPRMMLKAVLFSCLNSIYSCRKIENALQDRITFMWLSAMQVPDHNTINTFRSTHLKDTINHIFTQVVLMLVEMGYLSLDVIYTDGTKMESRANRYTFVWRKTVEKNKAKLEEKIRRVLEQIEEGIAQDNQPNDDPPAPINSEELKRRIAAINRETLSKESKKELKILKEKHIPKLQEYEKQLKILANRNSYSKTDKAATFMRMKDDHMKNGQLKPAYNVQIGTENQFYTHFDFYPNPTDYLTFIPFNQGFKKRYGKLPKKEVADSGYGSEENYEFMENNSIEPFVKYPFFHKEQSRSFKSNSFHAQNLSYNVQRDYLVCPIGLQMANVGNSTRKSANGYVSQTTIYQAENCNCCPLKSQCHQAEGNRKIEVNHKLNSYRKKARELLKSKEGLMYRRKRPIEPEAVFGQTKANKQYNRFRHFGLDKVKMDFAIFAIAFNIGKLYNKTQIISKNPKKQSFFDQNEIVFVFILIFIKKNLSVDNLYCNPFRWAA